MSSIHSRMGDARRRGALSAYRRRVLRTPKVALASAGLAMALSACSAETDVAPAPVSPSVTPTTTAAPSTPAPMATPTNVATIHADEPTFTPVGTFNENDALAFGQYYIQIVNHVRVTGDPSLLEKFSTPDCKSCDYIIELTNGLRLNGARLLHPKLSFEAAYLDYFDPDSQTAEVRVQISGDLGQVVLNDGSIAEDPKPLEHTFASVQMTFEGGAWKLLEIT